MKIVDSMWVTFLTAMENGEFPTDDDKWGLLNELGERLDRHLLPDRIAAEYPSIHALAELVNYKEFLDGFIGYEPLEQKKLLDLMDSIFEYEGLRRELLTSGFGLKITAKFNSDGVIDRMSFFELYRADELVNLISFGYSKEAAVRNLFDDIRRHKVIQV